MLHVLLYFSQGGVLAFVTVISLLHYYPNMIEAMQADV
jgi:hypothetical protein